MNERSFSYRRPNNLEQDSNIPEGINDQPTISDPDDAINIINSNSENSDSIYISELSNRYSEIDSDSEAETLPPLEEYLEIRKQKSPERERLEDFAQDLGELLATNTKLEKINREFKGLLLPFKRIRGRGGKILRIDNILARGGMGIVMEVSEVEPTTREALPGNYVLKFAIAAEDNIGMRNEFTREQIALSRMQREWNTGPHADIIPPMPEFYGATQFNVEKNKTRAFLTLQEKIEGQDLHNFNIQNIDDFAMIARNLMELIDELHRLGVYHGDIKPLNIMLSSTGNLRAVDFGAARIPELVAIKQSRFYPSEHPDTPRGAFSTPITTKDKDRKYPPGYTLPHTKRLVFTPGFLSKDIQQFDRDQMYLEGRRDADSIAQAYEKEGRFIDTYQVAATIESLFNDNSDTIATSATRDRDRELLNNIFHLTRQLKEAHNNLGEEARYGLPNAIADINDMIDQYFHNKYEQAASAK